MFNLWGEPISFAFDTVPGSQTVLYADSVEQFLLNCIGEAPMEVLGLADNVRQWAILHEDLDGQPINSALNNALVEVGEATGLIRYFRIDSFPLVLQPVELVGQSEPPIGLNAITDAVLHDYQPGDVVQTWNYANYYDGPPWLDHDFYQKNTVLARTETPTETTYLLEVVTFDVDSATQVTDSINLSFSKLDTIAAIPFDRFNGTQPSLRMKDYCGIPMWTYRKVLNTSLGYCPEENCWGLPFIDGPLPEGETTLVVGLGTYANTESIVSPDGYSSHHNIVESTPKTQSG